MYTNKREPYREAFVSAWQKFKNKEVISPLEMQIAEVILVHPELQSWLTLDNIDETFHTDSNPFLHLSLHLAIQDQIKLNKPTGIKDIYLTLLAKFQDQHQVEHLMIECLAQVLYSANVNSSMADERLYFESLKRL